MGKRERERMIEWVTLHGAGVIARSRHRRPLPKNNPGTYVAPTNISPPRTVSSLRNALQGCRRALAIWRQPDPRCRPLRTPERRSRVASSVARTRSLTGRVVLAEIHRHPSTVQRAIRTGQRSTKAKRTTTGGASKCGTERRGVHCATAAGAEGVPPKRG